MASNPIQRRARQSFLVGFLIALVIMAVVVFLLFTQINKLNQEKEQLIKSTSTATVYVATADIKSGGKLTTSSFMAKQVKTDDTNITKYMNGELYSQLPTGDNETDSETNASEYIAKVDIPAGTMVTENMITKSDEATDNSDRIVEYNMISLPSQLVNGDYVDIRLSLPNGQSYIVLSKKYVEQTSATGIWMVMSELDILTLNNAIVESYLIEGSNLYAVTYKEPGLQEAATPTYAVSQRVLAAINADPNVVDKAKKELSDRLETQDYYAQRDASGGGAAYIDGYTSEMEEDEKTAAVESGVSTETGTISSQRQTYVESLQGTGLVADTESTN